MKIALDGEQLARSPAPGILGVPHPVIRPPPSALRPAPSPLRLQPCYPPLSPPLLSPFRLVAGFSVRSGASCSAALLRRDRRVGLSCPTNSSGTSGGARRGNRCRPIGRVGLRRATLLPRAITFAAGASWVIVALRARRLDSAAAYMMSGGVR